MKVLENIKSSVTRKDFERAILSAAKGHKKKAVVQDALKNIVEYSEELYEAYLEDDYLHYISYKVSRKINNNGKVRTIKSPKFVTRVWQHFVISILNPHYGKKDNQVALNCKKRHGITSKVKNYSVVHRLKHVFYDRLDLNYALIIDQRHCYEHVKVSTFRKALKEFVRDRDFIQLAIDFCFVGDEIPVGTPTSPLVHHILMYRFDQFLKETGQDPVRYADDCIIFANSKEELQSLKWRIKNYWWYDMQIRAKRQTTRIVPLNQPVDFCGYVFHRKPLNNHQKGYTTVRQRNIKRALHSNGTNYPSYYGLLKCSDSYNILRRIEDNDMKLQELTQNIKIQREHDAKHVDMKSLIGLVFTIHDYIIRYNEDEPNWIKLIIGVKDETGREKAMEAHGNYNWIYTYLLQCEKKFGREAMLPLEDVEIEESAGYIFKGSTNQHTYIDEYEEYKQRNCS